MNFTREPIIETVITPRDGCKLVVRSSQGAGQEEYSVEAVEVVSFGRSHFYRSVERTNSFLVPVTDYEVVELKETRVALKNVPHERSIKIGGGRETSVRPPQPRETSEEVSPVEGAAASGESLDKKRDRRRRRRRGGGPLSQESRPSTEGEESLLPTKEGVERPLEETPAPAFISKLFPPPPTLIKETLSRYKLSEEETMVEPIPTFPEDLEPPVSEPKPDLDEDASIDE